MIPPATPSPTTPPLPPKEQTRFRQVALIFTGWAVLINLYYWLVGLSFLGSWQTIVAWAQSLLSRGN